MNERFLVGEEDGAENESAAWAAVLRGGETSEATGEGEGEGNEIEPVTSTLTRRTTAGMDEGRGSEPIVNTERSRVGDPARISLDDCRCWRRNSLLF